MPGLNQRGPMNQGAMTGRGLGTCSGYRTADKTVTDNSLPLEFGMRRGMGRRAGFGRGRRAYPQAMPPAQPVNTREDLEQRAKVLESELNAVKEALSNLS